MASDPTSRSDLPWDGRGPGAASAFSAGQVLSTSFRIFSVQALILVPLAAVFLALPLLEELSHRRAHWAYEQGHGNAVEPTFSDPAFVPTDGGGLASYALSSILGIAFQALVAWSVFQRLRGGRSRYGASFLRSLQRLPVVLVSGLLMALGMGIPLFLAGFAAVAGASGGVGLLLVIAAFVFVVYLGTRWFVGVQAGVVEPIGPVRALERSAWLTDGVKLRLFGMMLLVYGVPEVFKSILAHMLGDPLIPSTVARAVAPTTDIWIGYGIDAVVQAVAAVMAAVTYYELRRVREGTDLDQLLAVFD